MPAVLHEAFGQPFTLIHRQRSDPTSS